MSFREVQRSLNKKKPELRPRRIFAETRCRRLIAERLAELKNSTVTEIGAEPGPGLIGADGTVAFPFADASVKALVLHQSANYLRMDDLYMLFTELRRVVPLGGSLFIHSLHPGRSLFEKISVRLAGAYHGFRALELEHYFSPEDWKTENKTYFRDGPVCVELLELRRVNDPLTPGP